MNRIGIIGAMEQEVQVLKEQMLDIVQVVKAGMIFCKGKLCGKEIVIVRSGIGKVNMAMCTQILIDEFQVSALINTGIAGSLKNEINIGDIVVSTDTLQHDMDATGFGYPLGVIPQMKSSIFEADKQLIEIAKKSCETINRDSKVFLGRVVSGDQFISDNKKKEELIKNFSGYCTEMEGAAMAQVAYLNEVPFVILRAISDKADNSASMNYNEFEQKAIEHSVNLLKEMLLHL